MKLRYYGQHTPGGNQAEWESIQELYAKGIRNRDFDEARLVVWLEKNGFGKIDFTLPYPPKCLLEPDPSIIIDGFKLNVLNFYLATVTQVLDFL